MAAFSRGEFVRWLPAQGAPAVLIDAVHAATPKSDAYTAEIAEAAAKRLGSHCIVAVVSRTRADLNRPRTAANAAAIDEYRGAIRSCLERAGLLSPDGRLRAPFLHIAVHGMKNNTRCDVEIGTRHGTTCSRFVERLVVATLHRWAATRWVSREPRIGVNVRLIGDPSKTVHRAGHDDSGYAGYGPDFNTVQLELASWLRRRHRARVTAALVEIVDAFRSHVDGGPPAETASRTDNRRLVPPRRL